MASELCIMQHRLCTAGPCQPYKIMSLHVLRIGWNRAIKGSPRVCLYNEYLRQKFIVEQLSTQVRLGSLQICTYAFYEQFGMPRQYTNVFC